MKECLVAFVGNPNVGKSALINCLAGSKLKVGNWPGVTVEKREALLKVEDVALRLVDLPGVYTLGTSLEEKITRDFLIKDRPDLVVNVLDSTNLERNLYLTLQLAELGLPMVVVLNMWDEFEKKGCKLDVEKLSKLLGVEVITTIAVKCRGKDSLMEAILKACREGVSRPKKPVYSESLERFLAKLEKVISCEGVPKRWLALRILEGDEEFEKIVDGRVANVLKEMEEFFGEPVDEVVAEERYAYARAILKKCYNAPESFKKEMTDILDSIFMHRILGLPVFLFFMYLVFKITFEGSAPLIDMIDSLINETFAGFVKSLLSWAPVWFTGMVVDGIIQGVGMVISFVPMLVILYTFLALLEESGYMARAAFVMDRFMHMVGLHGKSFVPMVIGFGCNVPAILATRTLESERDRKITALLIPFMSCSARLPIYALFAGVFFEKYRAEVVMLMYVIGITVSVVVGVILDRFFFKGDRSFFVMELPPYRFPTLRMVWFSVKLRTLAFVKKAGTVIVASMILLWAATNLPLGVTPEESLLGRLSKTVAPVFAPCGFDNYRAVAALIPGTVAKEAVVGALGQMYGTEEEGLREAISKDFSPLSALSYMIFCLLWIPCVVTIGAIYREFGWRMVAAALVITTFVPYVVSALFYNSARLLGF